MKAKLLTPTNAGAVAQSLAVTHAAAAAESALANLGYARPHAERAVRRALESLDEGASLETLIKEALRVAAG